MFLARLFRNMSSTVNRLLYTVLLFLWEVNLLNFSIEGAYNTSCELSISTDYTMTSSQLQEESVTSGLWSPDKGAVDFAAAFGADPPAEFGCTDRKKHRQTGSDLLINSADPGILLQHHKCAYRANFMLLPTGSREV